MNNGLCDILTSPAGHGDFTGCATSGNKWFLVVDDEAVVRDVMARMLSANPQWRVYTSSDVTEALAEIKAHPGRYDVILTDLEMPGQNGFDFMDELDKLDVSIVRVVVTGHATTNNAIMSIRSRVFDIIKKPVEFGDLRLVAVRALAERNTRCRDIQYRAELEATCASRTLELRKTIDTLRETQRLLIEKFAAMAEMREYETSEHGKRVARMFEIIARKAGLSPADIENLSYGALLHDIGKIAVPDEVLLKRTSLTREDRNIINRHVEYGALLLEDIPFLSVATQLVRHHHEHYDGSGYPKGLRGDAIPLAARIFSIIDSYDAMRNDRDYRSALSEDEAIAELRRNAGTQFDPAMVDLFMECRPEIETVLNTGLSHGNRLS